MTLNHRQAVRGTAEFNDRELNFLDDRYQDNTLISAIFEFMKVGKQLKDDRGKYIRFGDDPKAPHRKRRRSWLASANDGEVGEFLDADFQNDLIEYIDGAIDVAYIALGGLIEASEGSEIVAQILLKEVLRSNETKLVDCEVRDDGKVVKGPYYEPPRIEAILTYFAVRIPDRGASGSVVAIPAATGPNLTAVPDPEPTEVGVNFLGEDNK
ncbi:MazG-like nucleotide pyrophosphohydrolase [Gordonia phage Lambo]|uniref:MazG-like nucleotide pyrophosphohydrolase n=1 Tax=Gordonia phage Lambo TaxID=2599845 RepID=A0A5J6TU66_9CAUD|nr:MazG-like nucleotide pyrophosphohydrolase [Gordonia phage Lambo]QFG13584.1 MazG-like nucleotide pyrophosphohydrolase [Gordonia phage Lambo]